MARYILIDNCSGYIFGDTAALPTHTFAGDDFPISQSGLTPLEAARWLDEADIREFGRTYEEVSRHALASNQTGYHVYRADVGGSDAVPPTEDGQNQEAIKAVERDCEYVTTVRCTSPADC